MKLSELDPIEIKSDQEPLTTSQALELVSQVPGWMVRDKVIVRQFKFKSFDEAMMFINRVADIARAMNHHPTVHNTYNAVVLELTTHKIEGLSINDFILAARINELF